MNRRITDPRMVPKNVKNPLQIAQEQKEANELRRIRNAIIGVTVAIGAMFLMKLCFDKTQDNHKMEIYNELSK